MIYYFIISFIVLISQVRSNSTFQTKAINRFVTFIMFCLMLGVSLLNPMTGDMYRYLMALRYISSLKFVEVLSEVGWEPGFTIYQWVISRISTSDEIFIIITVLILWSLILKALRKVITIKDIPLLIFGYMSFFYFYNFFTNVLRQGFAVVFVIFLIIYLERNDYKRAFFYVLAGLSFHVSSIISLTLFIVKKFKISVKTLVCVYATASLLMITGINNRLMSWIIPIFEGRIGNSLIKYTSDSIVNRYGAVNRIDFLLFTTVWIAWGLWFLKYKLKTDQFYEWLIKSYLTLGSVYVLFGFIAFSDRLAAYTWFLIPLLLFYPMIKMKSKYRIFGVLFCMMICILMFFFFEVNILYSPIQLFY